MNTWTPRPGLVRGAASLRAFELAGNPALGYGYVFALSAAQLAVVGPLVLAGVAGYWWQRHRA